MEADDEGEGRVDEHERREEVGASVEFTVSVGVVIGSEEDEEEDAKEKEVGAGRGGVLRVGGSVKGNLIGARGILGGEERERFDWRGEQGVRGEDLFTGGGGVKGEGGGFEQSAICGGVEGVRGVFEEREVGGGGVEGSGLVGEMRLAGLLKGELIVRLGFAGEEIL